MRPVLFHLFGYPVPSHGVLYVAGFVAGFAWAYRESRRVGIDPDKMLDVGFWLVIGVIIGSRVLYVAIYPELFAGDPLRVLRIWEGGMVLYGGVGGSIITSLVVIRLKKLPLGDAADIITESGALGLAIGRIGCLLAGCCYGRPTAFPWCITYTHPASLANYLVGNKCLHPTPVYSFIWLSVVFAFLVWLGGHKKFAGQLTWSFFIIYPLGRFVIEFYRGDPRGFVREPVLSKLFAPLLRDQTYTALFGGGFFHAPYLSTSQIISIASILAATIGYLLTARRAYRIPPPMTAKRTHNSLNRSCDAKSSMLDSLP